MKTHPHRAADLPASSPSRRAGPRVAAGFVAMLAALMLSTTAVAADLTSGVPIGVIVIINPEELFDKHEGDPNVTARFTAVTFSTTDYYDDSITGIQGKGIAVKTKTAAQLSAMINPPSNPFTVTAYATVTDDSGTTGSATISLTTHWAKAPTTPAPGASLSVTTQDLPAGASASGYADFYFSNAGAGARLTDVSFSTMDYYDASRTSLSGGFLDLFAKTSEELNAMDPPPPNPFTVEVTVAMTNNAGQTATGTIDYVTHY